MVAIVFNVISNRQYLLTLTYSEALLTYSEAVLTYSGGCDPHTTLEAPMSKPNPTLDCDDMLGDEGVWYSGG